MTAADRPPDRRSEMGCGSRAGQELSERNAAFDKTWLFREFPKSEIILDSELIFPYIRPIPIHSSRGVYRRRSAGGDRERHLRAMGDATSSPGRTRAASSATRSRPGQTTVKGQKAKMPRWRAARRGGASQCTSSSGVIRTSARSNPGTAPCRRADPLVREGDGSSGMRATPWPRAETGADFV